MCVCYYCIIQCIFTVLQFPCTLPIQISPQTHPLETTELFTVSIALPYPEYYIFGII